MIQVKDAKSNSFSSWFSNILLLAKATNPEFFFLEKKELASPSLKRETRGRIVCEMFSR
jgi:hypothetical protein